MSVAHADLARLFEEGRRLSVVEREAHYLSRGTDAATIAAVERLLTIDASPPTALRDTGLGERAWERTVAAVDPASWVGERLDRYRLLELVGSGGGGVVFRAVHEALDRVCAVKLLWSTADAGVLQREASIMARLQHPAIAEVFDAGVAERGDDRIPFIVMQYVKGPPITRYAALHRLDAAARASLLVPVGAAVDHAHGLGFVHRDIKPANVLVAGDERPSPKLVDFGIAALIDELRAVDDQGGRGIDVAARRIGALGTARYMSPEQRLGDAQMIDGRSDTYALGRIAEDLFAECAAEVPERALAIVREAMADLPTDRPASAREWAERLQAAAGSLPPRRVRSAATPASRVAATGLALLTLGAASILATPRRAAIDARGAGPAIGASIDAAQPAANSPLPSVLADGGRGADVHRPLEIAFGRTDAELRQEIRDIDRRMARGSGNERIGRLRRGIAYLCLGELEHARDDLIWVVETDRRSARGPIDHGLPAITSLGWLDLEAGRIEDVLALIDGRVAAADRPIGPADVEVELAVLGAAALAAADAHGEALQALAAAERRFGSDAGSARVRDIAAKVRGESSRRLGGALAPSSEEQPAPPPHVHAARLGRTIFGASPRDRADGRRSASQPSGLRGRSDR
ncbi:MAG TPA: serine/threonine-protein kinase [Phycisphaerales bacterium]|nr:serine/threonine-protein kinase [Phycisphaerales bacterium]HMP37474.1 serine/threonine-protein kinase [Phycisphaerales bacterium]